MLESITLKEPSQNFKKDFELCRKNEMGKNPLKSFLCGINEPVDEVAKR